MRKQTINLVLLFMIFSGVQGQDLLIHKHDGTIINIAMDAIDSVTFVENSTLFECGTSSISDIDGNTYNTVLIGNQCWMKENLKTTRFRNGNPIAYPGNDDDLWRNNTSGAYAWYENDISWKDLYGALYNWQAVNSANLLCPTGWRVPKQGEWEYLINYIEDQGYPQEDNSNGAGNAIKSCRQVNSYLGGDCSTSTHPRWEESSIHFGLDIVGFSALPGGYRANNGFYNRIGLSGYYWSSTTYGSSNARDFYIHNDYGVIGLGGSYRNDGSSVRCIKNN
ncbi:MAG: fibrobacter succinogenes major paralogous domain-containing protein [Bacteroidales bacterium]|nr:fibrobacter succinogenes major paralogous domain-containing protein [Bacteroidales bacterium]